MGRRGQGWLRRHFDVQLIDMRSHLDVELIPRGGVLDRGGRERPHGPRMGRIRDIHHPQPAPSQPQHRQLPTHRQRRGRPIRLKETQRLDLGRGAPGQAADREPARCRRVDGVAHPRHPQGSSERAFGHPARPWQDRAHHHAPGPRHRHIARDVPRGGHHLDGGSGRCRRGNCEAQLRAPAGYLLVRHRRAQAPGLQIRAVRDGDARSHRAARRHQGPRGIPTERETVGGVRLSTTVSDSSAGADSRPSSSTAIASTWTLRDPVPSGIRSSASYGDMLAR